jgi:hypothetical protein
MNGSIHFSRRSVALALFLGMLAASCASSHVVKLYDGDELESDRVAIVHPAAGIHIPVIGEQPGVRILRVDDIDVDPSEVDSGASIALLPGNHRLSVATTMRIAGKPVSFESAVPLQCRLEAGMEYSLSCRVTPGMTKDQPVIRFELYDASGNFVSAAN